MILGIDASRAFLKNRTGIEEYSYQVIRHLREILPPATEVVLYIRSGQTVDFSLPKNWQVKPLWAPRFWTQMRLSLEMLLSPPDTLFVPAHTVPWIHPKKTIVTIHGLEYEICPKAYSLWEYWYMRVSIKNSVHWASTVVAVSENTKKDLMRLYRVDEKKLVVIGEGFDISRAITHDMPQQDDPYFLFVGRLEERKNIVRIIEAFEVFKEKTGSPHKLILAGKFGYGKERIQVAVQASKYRDNIILPGYVSEEEKWRLLQGASAFIFPTLYEGFGIPVLEAQAVGIPVLTSAISSLPEIAGAGALLVDPEKTDEIARGLERLVSDEALRAGIIEKALHNVKRFSWASCARRVAELTSSP